jgi:hypothetical protein
MTLIENDGGDSGKAMGGRKFGQDPSGMPSAFYNLEGALMTSIKSSLRSWMDSYHCPLGLIFRQACPVYRRNAYVRSCSLSPINFAADIPYIASGSKNRIVRSISGTELSSEIFWQRYPHSHPCVTQCDLASGGRSPRLNIWIQ